MATVKKNRHFVEVSNISADWNFKTEVPGVVSFHAIKFFPGGAGDVLVIKEDSAAGPAPVRLASADGDGRVDKSVDKLVAPYIDYSECTFSAGALVLFVLDRPIS